MTHRSQVIKVPRFDDLKSRDVSASKVGVANVKSGTKPELRLRRALWAEGLRYQLHAPDLPGRPDIVFRRQKVAVFCDGDFWHGRSWRKRKSKLQKGWNSHYWLAKIERNRQRDREVNRELKRNGWLVIRIWETDITKSVESAAALIKGVTQRRIVTISASPSSRR